LKIRRQLNNGERCKVGHHTPHCGPAHHLVLGSGRVANEGLAFAKIKQQRDLLPFELPGALGTIEEADRDGKIEREKR
jgi:hypothetical protein